MLVIRMQRVGKKKLASYRLIINEKARDTKDLYIELLGTYNPHAKENAFQPVADRILYWISQGAQPSPTVNNLLVNAGIIKGKKQKSVFISKNRSKKLGDANKAKADAAAAAKAAAEAKATAEATAKAEAAAAAKAAAETPAPAPEATPAA